MCKVKDFVFFSNRDDLTYVEITEIHVSQSVEYPLTPKDTTIIGGTVSTKNGIGSGNFLVGYRRQTSDKGWVQVDIFPEIKYWE